MIPKYQVWDGNQMHEVRSIYFDEKYPGGFAHLTVPMGEHGVDTLFQNISGVPPGEYDYDLKLRQFTGLKDKNGKEIYEGDVVRIFVEVDPEMPQYVSDVFNHYGALAVKCEGMEIFTDYFVIGWLDEYDIEVIGNIYENPELLQE